MTENVSHETESLTLNIERQVNAKRAGIRKHVHHSGTLCSRCLEKPPRRPNDRYCAECRKIVMREHRAARTAELKRLRALAKQQKLEGQTNGQIANEDKG